MWQLPPSSRPRACARPLGTTRSRAASSMPRVGSSRSAIRGRTGEDGGYRGTLALAGTQVARISSGEMGESQLVDEQRRIVSRGRRRAPSTRPRRRRWRGAGAPSGSAGGMQLVRVPDAPARHGLQQPGDGPQQGGLAAAVGSDQGRSPRPPACRGRSLRGWACAPGRWRRRSTPMRSLRGRL